MAHCDVLPSVFTNIHLPFPFFPDPPGTHWQLHSSTALEGRHTPIDSAGATSGEATIDRDVRERPDQSNPLVFGVPLQELQDVQQRAVRTAIHRGNRGWVLSLIHI